MLTYSKGVYSDPDISLIHGFTTKQNGNMRTAQSMAHFFSTLQEVKKVVHLEQRHTNAVQVVSVVAPPFISKISLGDALVYRKKSADTVCLVVKAADCVPVLFADKENKVIGVAHSGWRGTLENIAAAVVQTMVQEGAAMPRIKALIGPSIGPCCYVVPFERAQLFRKKYPDYTEGIVEENGHIALNLAAFIRLQLIEAGLTPSYIRWRPFCTSCQADTFFSFRREGKGMGMQMGYMCI